MREAARQPRPVWRTWLAPVLAGWMALVVGLTLGAWRLAETTPDAVVAGLLFIAFVPAPLGLLVWSLWTMFRDPTTGWMAPSALLFFCGLMVPAHRPLYEAGARLNFEAHRPAYEEIVADVKSGRLTPAVGDWAEGVRGDVRFRYRYNGTGAVEFGWVDGLVEAGVRYNDVVCRPSRQLRCLDRGRPLGGNYFHYVSVLSGLTQPPAPAP